jgi:preprotein translocase SecE subunit
MKYFKDSVEEIKKVTWPTKKHAIQITVVTILFTAVTTAALTFVDGVLQKSYGFLLDKSPKSDFQQLVNPADLGIDTSQIKITDSEGNDITAESGVEVQPLTEAQQQEIQEIQAQDTPAAE